MKYFTKEWWNGQVSDSTAREYWPYIDTIRPTLTKDLTRLVDEVSLHDSTVDSFLVMPDENMAVLVLDGTSDPWCYNREPERARRFTLRYESVSDVTMTDENGGLISELDDSDLGYDEIERLPDGLFQHRMLFSSGIELHVTFKNLRFEFTDEE